MVFLVYRAVVGRNVNKTARWYLTVEEEGSLSRSIFCGQPCLRS
jgi:hypothetical protein